MRVNELFQAACSVRPEPLPYLPWNGLNCLSNKSANLLIATLKDYLFQK
jgi:hypothetical protein